MNVFSRNSVVEEVFEMDHMDLRNFKDFLQLYNQMSELCFNRCVYTFGGRELTREEATCTELCVSKHVKVNHKSMAVYMEVQPLIVNKRIEEMNEAQRKLEKEAEKTTSPPDSPGEKPETNTEAAE
ncbi:mitochondrial import inner membrane translocase subunit Tim10 B isoform X2 [Ischnura elegans]|uniref:mitochondrial import inner membrane translocase subunit Tim10 B isoform X2 n=1 Tax=Ischnura elegans TaxID=197161 RepID=UPI001ED86E1D|nr:mitochondrial import inner membrane translocase subunit Tim10 B isoform X2 [Ischnura elegans]